MHDKSGNVLAALAMSSLGAKHVMLDYLCVHPAVLSGEVPAKGLGTKMFAEACKYAASQEKGLTLTALHGAEGFYRKCGMKEDGEIFTFDKQGVKTFLEKVSSDVHAYGTSEGVKKEWDTRGRGQQSLPDKPYSEWTREEKTRAWATRQ